MSEAVEVALALLLLAVLAWCVGIVCLAVGAWALLHEDDQLRAARRTRDTEATRRTIALRRQVTTGTPAATKADRGRGPGSW